MEQQSGPPSTDGAREEVQPGGETTPDTGASQPETAVRPPAEDEAQAEAGPIMSSLPHTRPQQRSQRRGAAAKRRTGRQASGAAPRRKRATGQAQAATKGGAAARGSRAQARPSGRAATTEPRSGSAPGIPALAADAALQVAKAPFKLTVAATRKTVGLIGRGLRL